MAGYQDRRDKPAARTGGFGTPPGFADDLAERTVARIRWRLVPFIALIYFFAYLDRNNVGFAAAELHRDIGLTSASFGFGAGLFFIGYVLLEIPSNAAMHRFGARMWISRILITWGICATALAAMEGPRSFYIVRFLLGAAEAGFFPAILYYFTLWFPQRYRATILGLFVLAQPVTNAIGAPISGLLLTFDGAFSLHGWQWLFLLEGIPAIILGCLVPFFLTDRPESATWLSDSERSWLLARLAAEAREKQALDASGGSFLSGLKDVRYYVYATLNFGMVCGIYGLGLWMPTIVHAIAGSNPLNTGLLVCIPYLIAAIVVYPWSQRAARTGQIAAHAAISMVTAAIGLLGAGLTLQLSPLISMAFLCLSAVGVFTAIAPFLSMPSNVLAGAAAAAGLGVMNSLGNLGGFVAPYIIGLLKQSTGGNKAGLFFLAACLIVTAIAVYAYAHNRPEGRLRQRIS